MDAYDSSRRSSWTTPQYFSASDGGVEHSISRDPAIFDNSLVYNLLFSEGGLVIPDIFFFNCEPLIGHVARYNTGHWPLVLQALRRGLIIPAFRSEDTETFGGALSAIGGEQILGIEYQQYLRHSTQPELLAEALDVATAGSSKALRMSWPSNMGGRYQKVVEATFSRPELPRALDERQHDLWVGIEEWRETVPEAAMRATRDKGGLGLRRAEMFNALGARLPIIGGPRDFDKPRDLITAVDALRDEQLSRRVRFFVDVVNVTYQRSQATGFSSLHNSIGPLSPVTMSLYPDDDGINALPTTLEIAVRVPTVRTLLEADSARVLDAMTSGAGQGFFASRRAWMANREPTNETRMSETLRLHAEAYARELREVAKGGRSNLTIVVAQSASVGFFSTAFTKTLDFLANTDHANPAYGLVAGVVGAGVTFYVKFQPTRRHKLTVPRNPPETTIPIFTA
ncbi:hypothetical protein [Asanoa ferruginea]|nr:hypothetical protein [Asanoa ferruginea]